MVDGIQHDFTCAERLEFHRDLDGTLAAIPRGVVRPDCVLSARLLHVEHHDHALVADLLRDRGYKFRIFNRGRAERHLFHAEIDNGFRFLDSLYTATVTQGHSAFGRPETDHFHIGLSALCCRVDIQHNQLIGLFFVEDPHGIYRVADILIFAETNGFNQSLVADKQARDDPGAQHGYNSAKFLRSRPPQ